MAARNPIDPALSDLFRAELEIHLPALSAGLLALEKEALDPKRLEALMRAAHSVKGAAKIVGLDEAVQVAHVMEDCFVAAQAGRITIASDAVDVLLRGVDALQRIGLPQEGGPGELSEDAHRQLVDAIGAVRSGAPASPPPTPLPAALPVPTGPPTLRPERDLDDAEAEGIRGRLADLLRQGTPTIRLDSAAVRALAPAGLALLARAARAAARRQPPTVLQLANASPEVLTLLRLTRLESAFAVGGGSVSMAADRSLIYEFVSEAKEHLANVSDDLLALEQHPSAPAGYRIDRLFRAVHSVKGGAGYFGCRAIESLAHAMETVLGRMREQALTPESGAIDALLAGADRILTLLDDVEHSNEADVADVLARLTQFLPEGPAAPPPPPALVPRQATPLAERSSAQAYLYEVKVDLVKCHKQHGRSPYAVLQQIQAAGAILDGCLDVPDGDLDAPLPTGSLAYQALVASALPPSAFAREIGLAGVDITLIEPAPAAEAPAPPPPSQPAPVAAPPPAPAPAAEHSSIRIPVQLLDRLMTLAGELVLVLNQSLRSVDPRDDVLRPVVQRLDAVTSELQGAVLLTRMQPVGNLFGRFPRMVRDLARQLGKQIELETAGTEVELDKTILEALSDPLTHLIRNSCDHGIEPLAERLRAGKPAQGKVALVARHIGGQIYLEVRDDGKGIDASAVKRKAQQLGLKTPAELARMSERDLLGLILLPGFSTAAEVTDLSGRGVGMDVVKTNIHRLGGALEIRSEPGRGTTFLLRLPLTLAIIPCLMVAAAGERYAIPQKDLEELVCLIPEQARARVEYGFDQEMVRLRDRLLPLVRLTEVLRRPAPFTPETRAEILAHHRRPPVAPVATVATSGSLMSPPSRGLTSEPLVATARHPSEPLVATEGNGLLYFAVVKVGSRRFGLIVDDILNTEEIVVKPMHAAMKGLACFSGATVMGDGRVALILSSEGIARHVGVHFDPAGEAQAVRADNGRPETQTVLLFRSGAAEQFGVPLAMIRRLQTVELERVERVGGLEFLTVDGVSTRVLRLDRFLNVSPCEERTTMFLLLPRNLRRPMGILASAILDTEALPPDVNSDAYRADALIGSALVRGRMTLLLDVYRLADLADPGAAGAPAALPGPRRRVLLIEDTQFFRELVRGYLQAAGYEVVTAVHGAEALERLDAETFDAVVSDIEMPVLDGWGFARAARQRPGGAGLPLLALTTLDSDADRERARACGFDRYEVKVDRERFLAALAGLLRERGGANR